MTYIFMVAGKGARLHPLTLRQPKSLYKLDKNTTILQRMVNLIKKYDHDAEIVIVDGFMHETIEAEIRDVIYVYNPFYEVTNSIASLWFAKSFLDRENITIINGDIVMDDMLVREIVCKKVERPIVLLDSSIKSNGDYNVQVNGDRVLVMSKDLDEYYGEYAGITKLNKVSAQLLKVCMEEMIDSGMYDQWYENVLDQMIFNEDFSLFYTDICEYKWTEVDCVSDMLLAKRIHLGEAL